MVMTLQKDLTPSDVVLSCFHFRHLGLHYWMVPTKKFIPPHSADFYAVEQLAPSLIDVSHFLLE